VEEDSKNPWEEMGRDRIASMTDQIGNGRFLGAIVLDFVQDLCIRGMASWSWLSIWMRAWRRLKK
jgi:hypothetical protein